jgi:hypothetical protein
MLLLQQPGRSPYSTLEVDACDELCQRTPVCAQETLSCAPPTWSPRRQTFLRLENYAEGVRRYHDIAEVIDEVAQGTSTWRGAETELKRLLVTVVFHESGFRRDVHAGSVRGDCDYRVVAGLREPIPGSCRSHCLGQIYLQPNERTARGYSADELVGLDQASTKRCLQTVADRLGKANRSCTARENHAGVHAVCTFRHYGGVTSPGEDARIRARVKTYERLRRASTRLPGAAVAALAED